MSVNITITQAGLAELVNATATGTQAITIAAVGISGTAVTPDPALTSLAGELYRISAISGSQVSPDTIHIVMQDSSANAYSALSFALYLADGTLFAIYGQATPIYTKTANSVGMLAVDITFASALAGAISFGNANFINPPASQTAMGVVQLATLAQAQAGTDAADVLTPATAAQAVMTWLLLQDGAGSGLDADLFHGLEPGAFLLATDPTTFGSTANGQWEKRANGVIEQWNAAVAIPNGSNITSGVITFPIPFTSLPSIAIQANASGEPNPLWGHASIMIKPISLTQAAWIADTGNTNQQFQSGISFSWSAKGR